MAIRRYEPIDADNELFGDCAEDSGGNYVLYADHTAQSEFPCRAGGNR